MSVAVGARVHQLAGAVSVLFVLLYVSDGLWKPALVRGPYINFWLYDLAAWLVLPTAALFALHSATSLSPKDYGLSAELGWRDVAYVLPLPLFFLFAIYIVVHGIADSALKLPAPQFSAIDALKPLGSLWIVGTLFLAATAGFWESVFWIGLPWFALGRTLRGSALARRLFTIATALLFGMAHYETGLANAIAAFCFQLAAASWYFKLGTLWPIIGAHTLIDVYCFWPWPWLKT